MSDLVQGLKEARRLVKSGENLRDALHDGYGETIWNPVWHILVEGYWNRNGGLTLCSGQDALERLDRAIQAAEEREREDQTGD